MECTVKLTELNPVSSELDRADDKSSKVSFAAKKAVLEPIKGLIMFFITRRVTHQNLSFDSWKHRYKFVATLRFKWRILWLQNRKCTKRRISIEFYTWSLLQRNWKIKISVPKKKRFKSILSEKLFWAARKKCSNHNKTCAAYSVHLLWPQDGAGWPAQFGIENYQSRRK